MSTGVSPPVSPGHVFIVQGDLSALCCDFRAVPTGPHSDFSDVLDPDTPWFQVDLKLLTSTQKRALLSSNPPKDFVHGKTHCYRIEKWPEEILPLPFVLNVVPDAATQSSFSNETEAAHWYALRSRDFFDAVGQFLSSNGSKCKPSHGRDRFLVAIPIVGSGGGGAAKFTGTVLSLLMAELYRAAWLYSYDVVLVPFSRAKFTAALNAREAFLADNPTYQSTFAQLGEPLLSTARSLAKKMCAGNVALFVGAGCGVSAGLPLWKDLLAILADRAGICDDELKQLQSLSFLDQSQVIEFRMRERCGSAAALQDVVAEVCKSHKYSMLHAVLACLPSDQVITTNYDTALEDASRSIQRPITVLPYESATQKRWLLKMHGCVQHPSDIVITREDYVRYSDRRAALFGIVQAQLITKHLLFVGYSMSGDDFWQILSDVKKAIHPDFVWNSGPTSTSASPATTTVPINSFPIQIGGISPKLTPLGVGVGGGVSSPPPPLVLSAASGSHSHKSYRFGTALCIKKTGLVEELWKSDINMPNFETPGLGSTHPQNEFAACARRHEIFLDYLLSKATTSTQHILDVSFDHVLTTGEKLFRDRLIEFLGTLPGLARQAPVFQTFENFLKDELGYQPGGFDQGHAASPHSSQSMSHPSSPKHTSAPPIAFSTEDSGGAAGSPVKLTPAHSPRASMGKSESLPDISQLMSAHGDDQKQDSAAHKTKRVGSASRKVKDAGGSLGIDRLIVQAKAMVTSKIATMASFSPGKGPQHKKTSSFS